MHSLRRIIPRPVKTVARRGLHIYRRAGWRGRLLPHFIIIGAQKSGTTSLYHYLSQHPGLIPSYGKEVHFFDGGLDPEVDNFAKGQAWYQSHFPLRRHVREGQRVFEASPLYMFNPLAPPRICELIPDVKLIAILRDPAERAISHYCHERREGRESLPMMEAFLAEEERLAPAIDARDYKDDAFIHHSYKRRGLYREQIDRYRDCFSMDRLLVLESDELFGRPNDTLRRVFGFVGVTTDFAVNDLRPRNVGGPTSAVARETYAYLSEYFRPHNQALYELLRADYGWR